jgi:hypothetical protein
MPPVAVCDYCDRNNNTNWATDRTACAKNVVREGGYRKKPAFETADPGYFAVAETMTDLQDGTAVVVGQRR